MARTSSARGVEDPYANQPVESILEQLLQSPPPEKPGNTPLKLGTAYSVTKPERVPSAVSKTTAGPTRTPYRPQMQPNSRAKPRASGSATGKYALAAASPVALTSKTTTIQRNSRTSEDNLNLSSATSDTYSNASADSFDSFAQPDEKLRAQVGFKHSDKATPHRTYWPKYSDGDCFVVAVSHTSLSGPQPVHKSVYTASKVFQPPARPRVVSKALPLPITLAAPQAQNGKLPDGAAKYSESISKDSSPTDWSSDASSISDDSGQEVKTVEETLKYLFASLQNIIPDVMEACSNDGEAAFEKLQRMQDDNTDAALASAALLTAPEVYHTMAEKAEILAEQYPGLPKSQIENCLHLYDGDLDKASADLLTKKFEDDARIEQLDRVIATELSIPTTTLVQSPARSAFASSPEKQAALPSDVEHCLREADDITKRRFAYLHKSFSTVKPAVLMSALSVSKGKLSFAKDILRGEGHDEVVEEDEVHQASDTSITTWKADSLDSHLPAISRSDSPPARYSKYPPQKNDPQTIYEKQRAEVRNLNKQMLQTAAQRQQLVQEGRHHDVSILDLKLQEMKRNVRAADNQAKENIFETLNKDNCAMREIDLHGLHVHEAVEKVHQLVEFCLRDPISDTFAKIITGRGKGSPDQISRLKPAVETYLTQRGILLGLEPGNNGVICINISRGQKLKPYNKARN